MDTALEAHCENVLVSSPPCLSACQTSIFLYKLVVLKIPPIAHSGGVERRDRSFMRACGPTLPLYCPSCGWRVVTLMLVLVGERLVRGVGRSVEGSLLLLCNRALSARRRASSPLKTPCRCDTPGRKTLPAASTPDFTRIFHRQSFRSLHSRHMPTTSD